MTDLRLEVLGAVRAVRDGAELALGGPRPRSVVAALVVARGRALSEDGLVDAAWDGDPPPAARQSLHTYVARLRGVIEPGRSARERALVLTRTDAGYALVLDEESVDAWRFRALAARGTAALRDGRAQEAVAVLDEALRLWGGTPFGDLAGREYLRPEVAALEELRLQVREDRAEAALAVGEEAALLDELASLTREHPLRERPWDLRARALYRDGRQADALTVLREARVVLRDELGVDPGPALRATERAVLDQDPSLDHRPAAAPVPAASAPRRAVPVPLTSLVGRAGELDDVRAALREARLVTAVGPGGIGKTRVALEVARTHPGPDGAVVAELAELSEPSLLPVAVAEALGIVTAQTPAQLADAIGDSAPLLVLDNCEHLADAVAGLLAQVLPYCPELRVLATSREPLGVAGEQLVEIGPLTAGATQLFVDRARSAAPRWTPGEAEVEQVARICRELDGLPLAIELAAARSRSLSVDEMLDALDDRFALLVGGPRTGPERHRSLEATIALSADDLTSGQRRLFGLLSTFAGGFDAGGAAAVAGAPVRADLDVLVAKSLVAVDPTAAGPRRYTQLESLRHYGERLLPGTERPAARERHRHRVRDVVEEADRNWLGADAARWFGRVRVEQANIRLAFETALADGDAATALRLAGAMGWYWHRFGRVAEGVGWATAALAAAGPDADPEALGLAYFAAAPLQYLAGMFEDAAGSLAAGLERMSSERHPTKVARGLAFRAYLAAASDPSAAPGLASHALETARAAQDGPGEAEALMTLGHIARLGGDTGTAIRLLTASVSVARGVGHGFAEASSGWHLVKTRLDRRESGRAVAEAVAVVRFMGEQPDVTSWLVGVHALAGALGMAGDATTGATLLGAVSAIGGEVGFQPAQMDPADSERHVALVRAGLSAEAYASATAVGVAGGRTAVAAVLERISAAAPTPAEPDHRTA